MKKYKFDFIIIISLIILAAFSWLVINFLHDSVGNYVEVLADGKLLNTYSLEEDGEYEIKTGESVNIIQIKDGQVFMKEADCPDKLCVKQGKISRDGQSIICLPHKIVIRITLNEEDKVDAYAR
ncbi:MAG: NusG domain II-containing protein [Eubacterium sp.]